MTREEGGQKRLLKVTVSSDKEKLRSYDPALTYVKSLLLLSLAMYSLHQP